MFVIRSIQFIIIKGETFTFHAPHTGDRIVKCSAKQLRCEIEGGEGKERKPNRTVSDNPDRTGNNKNIRMRRRWRKKREPSAKWFT